MKKYRLEGEPEESEMVECDFGEYVKLEDFQKLAKKIDRLIGMNEDEDSIKASKLLSPFLV